jgi:hypothetical protein
MPFTLENWLVLGFPGPLMLTEAQRHCLIYDIRRFLMRLHGAGFRWPDIHPKHIFAEPAPRDGSARRWEFRLIDVERMERHDDGIGSLEITTTYVPDDERAFSDIRKLLNGLRPVDVTSGDIKRFWAGYCLELRMIYRKQKLKSAYSRLPMPKIATPSALPRLPHDYEHPRANPLERFKQIFLDARMAVYLRQLGWHTVDDVFAYERGQSFRKPGLRRHRERIRVQFPQGNGALPGLVSQTLQSSPLRRAAPPHLGVSALTQQRRSGNALYQTAFTNRRPNVAIHRLWPGNEGHLGAAKLRPDGRARR